MRGVLLWPVLTLSFNVHGGEKSTMNKKRIATFRWLLGAAEAYRFRLFSAVLLASVSTLLSLVPMVCVYWMALDFFSADGMVEGRMLLIASVALGAVVCRFATYFLSMRLSHICAYSIHYDLRSRIAAHIALLPFGFFDRNASGKIKKIMGEDVENVELFIGHYLPDSVAALVLPVFAAALLFSVDMRLALVALIPLPLAYVMNKGMNRVYRDKVEVYHDNEEKLNSAIVEYVRAMPVIKAFNQTAQSFRRYEQALKNHLKIARDWNRRASGYASMFWVSLDLSLPFILAAGFLFLAAGTTTPPKLILFLLLGIGLMEPFGRIIMISGLLDRIGEGIVRIQAVLNETPFPEPETVSAPDRYTVEFRDVSFAYGEKNVLEQVSFVLREGSLNGFVGPSGAGKSTAARLIPRFWDVTQGEILVGGRDIRQIPSAELMQSIAFVFQDVYLMNDTIKENIRMGRKTASDEEVVAAAESAAAHEFITGLEQGYDTVVGEGGAYLSGGEKQRISIARALLKDAPIVILDEATAFADPENESRIQRALKRLMAGKTVIVIAHRLPAIQHADQILLFDRGRIRAAGTHAELLHDDLYGSLWSHYEKVTGWQLPGERGKHA